MKGTSWLQDELKRAKEIGLTVQIEGRSCVYNNIEALSYVLGEPAYMLDYVCDEEGKITGLCFDRLSEDDFA